MDCKDIEHSPRTPKNSIAACHSSSSRKDRQVSLCTIPTTVEPSPVAHNRSGVQQDPSVSPTAAEHFEEVFVTPPTTLNISIKSRTSVGPMCRICHEGEGLQGTLIRPCWCSGTMAAVHRVCLERWLNMVTSEKCELCGYKFHLQYTSRPFWEFMLKCDNSEARRAFKVDLVCLLVLTPMAALSVYLCSVGALQYTNQNKVSFAVFTHGPNRIQQSGRLEKQNDTDPDQVKTSGWEAMSLITVAVLLIIIYAGWAIITLRYHVRVWRQWRVVHQDVSLANCTPSTPPNLTTGTLSSPATQYPEDPTTPNSGQLNEASDSSLVSPS